MPNPIALLDGRPTGVINRADVIVGIMPDAPEVEGRLVVPNHLDVLLEGFRAEEVLRDALADRWRRLRPPPPPPAPSLSELIEAGHARLREERERVDRRWLDQRIRAAVDLRALLVP